MICSRWSFPFLDFSCQPGLASTLDQSSCASLGHSKQAQDWFTTWRNHQLGASGMRRQELPVPMPSPRGIRRNRWSRQGAKGTHQPQPKNTAHPSNAAPCSSESSSESLSEESSSESSSSSSSSSLRVAGLGRRAAASAWTREPALGVSPSLPGPCPARCARTFPALPRSPLPRSAAPTDTPGPREARRRPALPARGERAPGSASGSSRLSSYGWFSTGRGCAARQSGAAWPPHPPPALPRAPPPPAPPCPVLSRRTPPCPVLSRRTPRVPFCPAVPPVSHLRPPRVPPRRRRRCRHGDSAPPATATRPRTPPGGWEVPRPHPASPLRDAASGCGRGAGPPSCGAAREPERAEDPSADPAAAAAAMVRDGPVRRGQRGARGSPWARLARPSCLQAGSGARGLVGRSAALPPRVGPGPAAAAAGTRRFLSGDSEPRWLLSSASRPL